MSSTEVSIFLRRQQRRSRRRRKRIASERKGEKEEEWIVGRVLGELRLTDWSCDNKNWLGGKRRRKGDVELCGRVRKGRRGFDNELINGGVGVEVDICAAKLSKWLHFHRFSIRSFVQFNFVEH